MSKKKIVDLAQYRKKKEQNEKKPDQSRKDSNSFEEKLQDLIHSPFSGIDSEKELIAIFEDEQLKRDTEDETD